MRLHHVALENFRQHAESRVEFPAAGVTGIVGPNEGGKSTLLEAVAFALFGTAATRGTKSSLRWNRAPARHTASVELAFEVGGKRYRVERGETDARLYEDGKPDPIAAGVSAVDDYVPRLLGMTLDEYEATYLTRQKDLARLADMGGVERRQFFLRILGVGRIDEALSECRARKNELARERAGLEAGLGERAPLEDELAEARKNESEAGERSVAAQERAAEAETYARELDEKRAALDTVARRHDELERDRRQAELYAQQAGEELERVERKVAEHPAADFDPKALERARAEFEACATRVGELEEKIQAEERARREKVQEARVDLSTLARHGKEARARVEKLESLGEKAECPTCRQPIGAHVVELLGDEKAELGRLREEHRHLEKDLEAISEPSDREMELRAEREAAQEERKRAAERAGELERKRQAAERVAELREEATRWKEKEASARKKMREADLALLELDFDPEAYETACHDANHAAELASDAREERARAQEALRSARERLERAEAALEAWDERAEALRELVEDHRTHERTAEGLADFRAAVAGSIRPEMEALASGFVQLLTDGRHEGLVLDEDFNSRLLESGIEVEVASGGTEDIAAIAMRLAVSQMIAERAGHPLSLLVLDEPFGSLDAVRRENVLTLIRRLGGVFEQVLLITHVEEAKDAVDHALLVEFDETEGRSTVRALGGLQAAEAA